jgi:hypothetical protein
VTDTPGCPTTPSMRVESVRIYPEVTQHAEGGMCGRGVAVRGSAEVVEGHGLTWGVLMGVA